MRPTIPAEGQPTAELEQGLCKSVAGTVRGSIVHRDLLCLVVAAGIAVAWIEGLESAPEMPACAWFKEHSRIWPCRWQFRPMGKPWRHATRMGQ